MLNLPLGEKSGQRHDVGVDLLLSSRMHAIDALHVGLVWKDMSIPLDTFALYLL